MDRRIAFFGGETRGLVQPDTDDRETVEVVREVWFDRDIDGRWLVWATDHDGFAADGEEGLTGAIVVKNRDVGAFLERLGRLIADPAAFEHEPVFLGADDAPGSAGGWEISE